MESVHWTISGLRMRHRPSARTLQHVAVPIRNICTYLNLRLMCGVAGQLVMPISCQCRSSLFLNMLTDGASTTSCGNLFHSLMIRKLKKFSQTVVRHLGLNTFNEWPLSPLVTSASWKNLLQLTCSFPVNILNVSIKSPRSLRLSKAEMPNFFTYLTYLQAIFGYMGPVCGLIRPDVLKLCLYEHVRWLTSSVVVWPSDMLSLYDYTHYSCWIKFLSWLYFHVSY